MVSPAGIPSADEALKALIGRFRSDPSPAVFAELAGALLARGHATEALRIAEHGLELAPGHVEGRVERASALLALGKPRMAYVELRRVVAIDPRNRRALRLLGQSYKDAGAPERAAQLLTRRLQDEPDGEHEVTAVTKAPDFEGRQSSKLPEVASSSPSDSFVPLGRTETPTEATERPGWIAGRGPSSSHPAASDTSTSADRSAGTPPSPRKATHGARPESNTTEPIPDLVSELTKDLVLGSAVPPPRMKSVEVTQIIRRRGPARPARTDSELAAIEGPIVDRTQPGNEFDLTDETPHLSASPREPISLMETSGPTAQMSFGSYAFEEEPLPENLPFAIRPVLGEGPEAPSLSASAPPASPRAASSHASSPHGSSPHAPSHAASSPAAASGATAPVVAPSHGAPPSPAQAPTPPQRSARAERDPRAPRNEAEHTGADYAGHGAREASSSRARDLERGRRQELLDRQTFEDQAPVTEKQSVPERSPSKQHAPSIESLLAHSATTEFEGSPLPNTKPLAPAATASKKERKTAAQFPASDQRALLGLGLVFLVILLGTLGILWATTHDHNRSAGEPHEQSTPVPRAR